MTTSDTSRRPWTIDDLFAVRRLSDAQVSPDGQLIAYVSHEPYTDGTKAPRSRIWVVGGDGEGAREYTAGPRSDHAPRWSPDGRTLAFLADREEDGRVGAYLLPRDGGEARKLCDLAGGAVDLAWSPDGSRLALLVEDPRTEEEKGREERKDDAILFEEAPKYQRVWVVGADGAGLRRVTGDDV